MERESKTSGRNGHGPGDGVNHSGDRVSHSGDRVNHSGDRVNHSGDRVSHYAAGATAFSGASPRSISLTRSRLMPSAA